MDRRLMLSIAASAALLAACGGGGGAPSVPDTVPPSATASPEAFTQFVAAQAEDEQREPLAMDGVAPPASETAEPLPVAR